MTSFETLDTEYKESQGCRGVGRLLWLKAFEHVQISSTFAADGGLVKRHTFPSQRQMAWTRPRSRNAPKYRGGDILAFRWLCERYRDKAAKTSKTIAGGLIEHCLWYFVREGGAPTISIRTVGQTSVDDVYDEFMFTSATKKDMQIKGAEFAQAHPHRSSKPLQVSNILLLGVPAGRLVEEETIVGKIPGLYGKIRNRTATSFMRAM